LILFSLLLLALIPIGGYIYAKRKKPDRKFFITGIALGSIISPLSMGIYAIYYIPIIGLVPGLIGLISSLFHGPVGYNIAIWIGLHKDRTVVTFPTNVIIEVINGVFWGFIYGLVGYGIDQLRRKLQEERQKASAHQS
jgi:hypothetical protein